VSPVVVIGAGLAGLSAACYLTRRGYDVTEVEREQMPGGRAGVLHRDGLTCGSVDAAAFDTYVDRLRRLYVIEMPNFIDRNYDSPLGLLSSPRALTQLVRLGGFGRLGAAVRKRFADSRLRRLFSFQAMYAGLSPDSALALCAVITSRDAIEGVWFPEGGLHMVPRIIAQVAEKAGVTFRYGNAVDTVLRSPMGWVAGVRTTSLDDSTMAPTGRSTLYVLEPLPNLNRKINWPTDAKPLRDRMDTFLAEQRYPSEVVTEELVNPLDWQAQGMAAGTPFALAHTFEQTGPFRPSNVERLPGMFFAGSGTVPGVCVPMVLISGKLAASRVAAYLQESGQ
jgi:phytoene dehydrogenase-like protein